MGRHRCHRPERDRRGRHPDAGAGSGRAAQHKNVEFPPILVTQEMLRSKNIKNMDDLRANEPSLNISDTVSADWIPAVKF